MVFGEVPSPSSYTGGKAGDVGLLFKIVDSNRQFVPSIDPPLETILYLDSNVGEDVLIYMPDGSTGGVGTKIPTDDAAPLKYRYKFSVTKGNGAVFTRKDGTYFNYNTYALTSDNQLVVDEKGYLYIGEDWRIHAINEGGQRRLLFQAWDENDFEYKTAVPYIIS